MTDTGRAVVLDVIGLEREHVDAGLAPNIAELVPESARADLEMPFPAVTLPAQSTLATGRSPKNHGDVANGEYDRDTDSVALWERDREGRDRLWETASEAGLTTGVFCFQHLIGTSADVAQATFRRVPIARETGASTLLWACEPASHRLRWPIIARIDGGA